MLKSIIASALVLAVTALAGEPLPGQMNGGDKTMAFVEPRTNGEAFAQGMPPLNPRHATRSGSNTKGGGKSHPSKSPNEDILNFDEKYLNKKDGPLPSPYRNIDFGCSYGSCGYERASEYPRWAAKSKPNAFYFYANGFPTLTSTKQKGLLRLQSLYCAQGLGAPKQLYVSGRRNGQNVFTKKVECAVNSEGHHKGKTSATTFNKFSNLPEVDSLHFSSSSGVTSNKFGWALDNIRVTNRARSS
ncbi:hypothetical protein P389DRAFT_61219 [Cystobasidium minutum MCA 4210]|uniref:uncharacterized protein n=1 Tax=Cystobasidium minutum MCA 4210 TaxID=1397322 RepID=UPI0034CF1701|eukprot:jgi/Rhomi1/61219/CE61218_695